MLGVRKRAQIGSPELPSRPKCAGRRCESENRHESRPNSKKSPDKSDVRFSAGFIRPPGRRDLRLFDGFAPTGLNDPVICCNYS